MREIPEDSKVAVAMSGGVDSGVAASLLVEQGYEVVGFFMHLWHETRINANEGRLRRPRESTRMENRCCSVESMEAARKTAGKLGIPFYTVDYRQDFKEIVVDYFLSEYRAGRTPNPCVVCNKFIKFGKLLDYAKSLGCDYLATGHYARIACVRHSELVSESDESNNQTLKQVQGDGVGTRVYRLLKGVDEEKDQSYFLWQLSQEQLEHILFPVGELTKEEVRKIAQEKKLPVAKRPESFEICFIPDSLEGFLRRQIPEEIKPGLVIDTAGNVIGKHQGLPLYTYGQRRGFELKKYQGIPLYVIGVDKDRNALVVGWGAESEVKEFEVGEMNWIGQLDPPTSPRQGKPAAGETFEVSWDPTSKVRECGGWGIGGASHGANSRSASQQVRCDIRIRHQGELMPATIKVLDGQWAKVILDESTRAVTPGQSAVFYRGEEVLGGGVILGPGA